MIVPGTTCNDKREGGAVVRTTTNQTSKLTHQLPNTMRKRLPSPKYQTYLTPHQFEALAPQKTSKWPGLGGGRARERQGKGGKGQAHAPRRLCQAQGGTQGAPWPAEEEQGAPCWPRGPAAARARRCLFEPNGCRTNVRAPVYSADR